MTYDHDTAYIFVRTQSLLRKSDVSFEYTRDYIAMAGLAGYAHTVKNDN